MDPLTALREYTRAGRLHEVEVKGDRVQFGDALSFPKAAKTGYVSKQGKGEVYDLESLVLFAR